MHALPRVPRRLVPVPLVLALALGVTAAVPGAAEPAGATAGRDGTPAHCGTGPTVVRNATRARHWAPVTPAKWEFPGSEIVLAEAGTPPTGPRRPFEYAVLEKGPEFGSVRVDARVRLDTPVEVSNRDVVIVFGYRSPTEFYYVHLSSDNTIYPHNGVFVVDNADRLRIDDQWNGSVGARPAITDARYHWVRVRHCADTGEIAVYVDGAREPLMTATDTTFDSGRVGFGSFDNVGRMRDLTVKGAPARSRGPGGGPHPWS